MTGPAIGRPKSATFRTHGHRRPRHPRPRRPQPVASGSPTPTRARRSRCRRSSQRCSSADWIGEKAGQGFYKREKRPDGASEILTLDPGDADVPPAAVAAARRRSTPPSPSTTPASGSRRCSSATDRVGEFLRATLGADAALRRARRARRSRTRSTTSIARCAGASAGSSGPFEIWDAIGLASVLDARCRGVRRAAARRRARCRPAANRFRDGRAAAGRRRTCRSCRAAQGSAARRPHATPAPASSISATACSRVEFHSKMNAIGGDTIEMLQAGVKEAARELRGARRRQRRAELLGRRQPDARCCSRRRRATGTRST